MRALKHRSVVITEDVFENHRDEAVKWENIGLEHYVALHNAFGNWYAHDAHVKNIMNNGVKIYNPGRNELTVCTPDSFQGYEKSWLLVPADKYQGPTE